MSPGCNLIKTIESKEDIMGIILLGVVLLYKGVVVYYREGAGQMRRGDGVFFSSLEGGGLVF